MASRIESIEIRHWRRGDEEVLAKFANNRRIWRNLTDRFPHPYDLASAVAWISTANTQPQDAQHFAIIADEGVGGGVGVKVVVGVTVAVGVRVAVGVCVCDWVGVRFEVGVAVGVAVAVGVRVAVAVRVIVAVGVWVCGGVGVGEGVYGSELGEAWRLPGNNVLNNYGSGARMREVTPDGQVVMHDRQDRQRSIWRETLVSGIYICTLSLMAEMCRQRQPKRPWRLCRRIYVVVAQEVLPR